MSRPKKEFTTHQVRRIKELAYKGLRDNAIASIMGIDENTFYAHFQKITHKKRAERRLRLLELQFEKAEQKDATMLVWLGKNELDQSDKAEVKTQTTDSKPLSPAEEIEQLEDRLARIRREENIINPLVARHAV